MNHISSGESSKPHSPKIVFLIGELKEAKRTITQKDEKMRQMEEKLQRLELAYERPHHVRRHHQRHESRSSKIIMDMKKKPNGGCTILKIGANMWQSLIYHL